MLSFTTSNRRRGLRGAGRKSAPTPVDPLAAASVSKSPPYSLSISSRASSSSIDTVSQLSMATSATTAATSISLASSSHCDDISTLSTPYSETSQHSGWMSSQSSMSSSSKTSSRSPIEIVQLKPLADPRHTRQDSTSSSMSPEKIGGLRVVGRGGQGSRPRPIPVHAEKSNHDAPHPVHPPPHYHYTLRSQSAIPEIDEKKPAARVVGRGGEGSRPRGLAAPAAPPLPVQRPEPPPPPPSANALIQQTPQAPVLYRPGGRGGAGSRPRRVKPQSDAKDKPPKELKLPWKGKGKEKADPSALTVSALTRTDTIQSTASSIQFAAAAVRPHQKPDYPSNIADTSVSSHSPSHSSVSSLEMFGSRNVHQQSNRINKVARTLGAEFGFSTKLWGPSSDEARAAKLSRRSSMSVSSLGASQIPRLAMPTAAEKAARRRSSYGSIPSPTSYAGDAASISERSEQAEFYGEVWDTADHRRTVHMNLTRAKSTEFNHASNYPRPPRPPRAFSDEPEHPDDAQSEILSFDYTTGDAHDVLNWRCQSTSPPLHVQPRFSPFDTDDEYERDQATTPVPRAFSPYSPSDTSMLGENTPFSVIPIVVSPAWETDKATHGWSGEWNRPDMQDVIRSLRDLKM
ncbi:hypothetical protein B0H10DRAFT_2066182 [Mycena sp. CBHHK59/15]|nr:hypothetical protein B0H10DRAFT_2066182 [Mycena sp. CBHHK59/15]